MYGDPDTQLPSSMSLFPNNFIILIGPPATGKGRVIKQEGSIIKSPRLEAPDKNGQLIPLIPYAPDATTVEALSQYIAACSRSKGFKVPNPKGGDDLSRAIAYCPCTFLIEELEVLFKSNSGDMVAMLCHCYDAGDLHYKTKNKGEDKIKNVCVNLIAGTTPDSIRDLMADKVVKKGLTSRTIMIYAERPRFCRQFPGLSPEQQTAYSELLGHIKLLTNVVGEVRLSDEAAKWHKDYYEGERLLDDRCNKSSYLDHYYGRKNIHWLKLAIAHHYSEQHTSNVIQLGSVISALDTLNRAEVNMDKAFKTAGRNMLYDSSKEIVGYLREAGPKGYNKMWWSFSNDLKKAEFDECVELLIRSGQVVNEGGLLRISGTKSEGSKIITL